MIEKILFIDENARTSKSNIDTLEKLYEMINCSDIKALKAPELLNNDLIIFRKSDDFDDFIEKIKYLNSLMIRNILLVIPLQWKEDFFKGPHNIEYSDVVYEPMLIEELLFRIQEIKSESDNLYYKILSQMNHMAMVLDYKRKILYVNEAVLIQTGYDHDEIIGKHINLLKSNEHTLLFYDNLRQTLDADNHWSGTFKNQRKDGSLYWEDASVFKIKLTYKEVYVKISMDVTRREKLLNQQEKETEVASLVQRSLLPLKYEKNNLVLDGFYKPFENVSGDIYNWLKLKDGVYAVYLLDVVGHGVASALITTSAISIINNLLERGFELDKLLKRLNNKMINMYNLGDLSPTNYYTLAIGIIDLNNKTIKYSNCGHPPIYMIENGDFIPLKERNFPIGLLSDKNFTYKEMSYNSPIELLFFSDGLIEIDFDKRKGIKNLEDSLYDYIQNNNEKELLTHLKTNLVDRINGNLSDDLTMTTVSINKRGDS